ncbi:MAG: ATP-binding protein, partial [Paracoccaceae bacterium]
AQSLYGLKAHEKGIGFVVDLDRSCDCVVRGDETRLRQILNNLVSNAIKFTDAGGVTLRARTRAVPNGSDVTQGEDPPEDRVLMTLEIEDTGIGLRCDQIPNLFKRFTQADASITRRFGGSGLGLAITSQLVDVMGGTIEVDSTYGQGSRFTVRLAFGVGGPAVPTDTDDAAMAALHDLVRARQPKLLVAEDNATNRMVLEHRLKRIGLTAEFVTDGAQALARYQPGAYDVVLMDVHMPVMDGVTATRAIRDREAAAGPTGPRVAIIAFSADAMREQVAQYLGVGMDAHLAKPGHRDDLVRVLAQVLT